MIISLYYQVYKTIIVSIINHLEFEFFNIFEIKTLFMESFNMLIFTSYSL